MQGSHPFKHCKGEVREKKNHIYMEGVVVVYLCTLVTENK